MTIWQVKKNNNNYFIEIKNKLIPCQIGKNGLIENHLKREGDLCTPIGKWKLYSLYYREDRCNFIDKEILNKIKVYKITKLCGWCDDKSSNLYNQKIKISHNKNIPQPHYESLWRDDQAYDIFFELGYNVDPVIKGLGSAIFLHCSFDDSRPTAGCVAIDKNYFAHALNNLDIDTHINISID